MEDREQIYLVYHGPNRRPHYSIAHGDNEQEKERQTIPCCPKNIRQREPEACHASDRCLTVNRAEKHVINRVLIKVMVGRPFARHLDHQKDNCASNEVLHCHNLVFMYIAQVEPHST